MGTSRQPPAESARALDAWTSRSLPDLALALGLAKQGRFDPGPDLLLLVHAGVTSEIVERWGLVLAADLVQRAGVDRPEVARALASDCLGFAGRLRKSRPLVAFAKDVGLGKATAGHLRTQMDTLIRRLCEQASARMAAAFQGREPDLPASRQSGFMDATAKRADPAAPELSRADLWRLLEAKWHESEVAVFGDLASQLRDIAPASVLVLAITPLLVERYGAAFAKEVAEQLAARLPTQLDVKTRLLPDEDPRFVRILVGCHLELGDLFLVTRARIQSEAFALFAGEFEPGREYSPGEVVAFGDEFYFAGEATSAQPGTAGAWESWWPPTAAEVAEEISAIDFSELDYEAPVGHFEPRDLAALDWESLRVVGVEAGSESDGA